MKLTTHVLLMPRLRFHSFPIQLIARLLLKHRSNSYNCNMIWRVLSIPVEERTSKYGDFACNPILSAICISTFSKLYNNFTIPVKRVLSSALLFLIGTRPVVGYGNETYN
jgi:hypothetical protein